jgi:hypothetical protein
MENQPFKISIKTVWFLILFNFLFPMLGIIAKIQRWEIGSSLLLVSITFSVFIFILFLIDMIRNKIYHKAFWILFLIIMPNITPFFYLVQRKKLINLGQKIR